MGRSISGMEKPGSIEELISSAFSLPSVSSEMVSWKGHRPRASSRAGASLTTHAHGQPFPFSSVFSSQKWDSSSCCRACSGPLSARHWLWRRRCVVVAEGRQTWPNLSLCFVCPLKDRGGPGPFCLHIGVPLPGLRLRLHSFVGLCSRWVSWVAQGNARDWSHGLAREDMRTGTLDLHVCIWQSAYVCESKLIFRIRSLALEPPCPTTALRALRVGASWASLVISAGTWSHFPSHKSNPDSTKTEQDHVKVLLNSVRDSRPS